MIKIKSTHFQLMSNTNNVLGTYIINDLVPMTTYNVYCISEAIDGSLPLQDKILVNTITTQCCKNAHLRILKPYSNVNIINYNSVEIEFEHVPITQDQTTTRWAMNADV